MNKTELRIEILKIISNTFSHQTPENLISAARMFEAYVTEAEAKVEKRITSKKTDKAKK